MQNGSVITFHANFDPKILGDWKHALTKPLHYITQWVTGSLFHHKGIYCDGLYYEAIRKHGVRKIPLKQKLEEIDACIDTYIFKPYKRMTKEETKAMKIDLDAQIGKKFSILQAFLSVFTAIMLFSSDEIKTKVYFCVKLVFYALRNIHPSKLNHILPRTLNPEEGIKALKRFKVIKEIPEVINGRT